MTNEEAIKILKDMIPKTYKMVYERYVGGFEDTECPRFEAVQVAVEALEKQIPKKPIKYDKYYYKCPVCDIDIGVSEEDLTIYEETPPYYCNKCGQALDWSDT